MKHLRKYQSEAYDAVFSALNKGETRGMVVLPTGAGKTRLSAAIATQFKRIMFLSHTEELISQSGAALLNEFYPEVSINEVINRHGDLIEYFRYLQSHKMFIPEDEYNRFGIVKADLFKIDSHITLASFQTIHRRLDRIPADWFDLIIVDECDLAAAKTIDTALKYFQPKLLLGLTATPTRSDGASLANVFDDIFYQYSIADAIGDGYLCELDCLQIQSKITLDNVRTTAGEFNQRDLSDTVDTEARNQLIVDKYKQYADNKQAVVFCIDVQHAQNVCEKFNEAGYKAEFVVGDKELTPDRLAVINRFKNGETQVLCNCMILTAGFDHPAIGCIILASPTKSVRKFLQQIGRGTRTLPGVIDGIEDSNDRRIAIKNSAKPLCTVLDIVDTTNKHRLINSWTLERELPLEQKVFMSSERKKSMIEMREKRKFEAQTKVDTKISLYELPKIKLSNSLKMKDPATAAQLVLLEKLGYDTKENVYTKGDANRLISNHGATEAQIKYLKWKGYNVSRGVTKAEATAAFIDIKAREEKEKKLKQLNNISPIDGIS